MALVLIGELLEKVADLETGAGAEVEVRLRTSGKVSLLIHTMDDDTKRTVAFKTIQEAIRFFD